MTGFEPGSSGIETTALPTAPQPLPTCVIEVSDERRNLLNKLVGFTSKIRLKLFP